MSTVRPPLPVIPPEIVAACDYARQARFHLDDNAWAYLAGGAADERGLAKNRDAFADFQIWPRVLADVRGGHTRCTLFGQTLAHPLLVAPVAYQRLFHEQGELATALGAGVMAAPMVVSSLATTRLEVLARQASGALWFQLYWQGDRARSLELVRRAEAAGYQALVLTVDAPLAGIRNREQRAAFHLPAGMAAVNLQPGSGLAALPDGGSPVFDGLMQTAPGWDDVAWLRGQTHLPLVIKGVLHPQDARQAVACGADGLIVSNHGGRVLDVAPAPLHVLPEIRAALGGSVPLLLDGGVTRGSDVLIALALGANAVLLGRPVMHALAVAGALGVAHLLRLLREELEITMALAGCRTLSDITPSCLRAAGGGGDL